MPTLNDSPNTPPDEPDPFDGLVLDADFVRAAAHKEGSARARMLATRWKHEPPAPAAWRAAPASPRGLKRLSLSWRGAAVVVLVVLLVLGALNLRAVSSWLQAGNTSSDSVGKSSAADAAHPFAGTPAANWPDGAAGIVVPTAHAVGVYSAAQVASDLAGVKSFLVASNLDPTVLAGGFPKAALAFVDPLESGPSSDSRSLRAYLESSWAHPTQVDDPTMLFSRFAQAQARWLGPSIKVKGTMSFGTDRAGGLRISVDYTFVYALVPGASPDMIPKDSDRPPASTQIMPQVSASPDSTDLARTIVRRAIEFDVPDPTKYQHTPGTFTVHDFQSSVGNTACGDTGGYFAPRFPGHTQAGPADHGPAVDPYDRSTPSAAASPTWLCGTDAQS